MIFRRIPQSIFLNGRRRLSISHQNKRDVTRVPLSEPLAVSSINKHVDKVEPTMSRDTRISRLSNGLRVVTESNFGEFVTLGIAVESGCRFENGFPFGTSRVVEKLAYSSSHSFPDRNDIYSLLEQNGGIIDCQSTRDTFMYAASCHRNGVDSITKILAETVWRPAFTEDDIELAKMSISFENEDVLRRIEAIEILMSDYIHQAAFQHNTLGYPKMTSNENAEKINSKHIYSYMSQAHDPTRMVIGGVGIDHDEFVKSVEKHFDISKTTWKTNPDVLLPNIPELDKSVAQYTGGELRKDADLSILTIGTPYPLLAHVSIGFEGCSYTDKDFVPFCVLQSLLGGGGAFSAGGPGKGMYARMYTEVMNRNHWIYSAIANNHSYRDTGLFTLSASCDPSMLNNALVVLLDQLLRLPNGTDRQELERAKTQLRSHLMMNLEVRPVLFEDMVRQVLGHDVRKNPEEYAEEISKVTNKDIIRVAERMLASKPSLVGYGNISKLSNYALVDQSVAKRNLRLLLR